MRSLLRYDHYKVLGISRDAGQAEIKSAYRALAHRVHPDHNSSPKAADVFHAVREAYEVLSDPLTKERYDEQLRYHRPAVGGSTASDTDRRPIKTNRNMWRRSAVEDGPPSWTFIGLHATGLVFGVLLTLGVLFNITFAGWSILFLVFCAPGMAVIPESYEGLRMAARYRDEAA